MQQAPSLFDDETKRQLSVLSRYLFSYRYCYILMLGSFLILLQITQRFLVRHMQNSLGLEKFHETGSVKNQQVKRLKVQGCSENLGLLGTAGGHDIKQLVKGNQLRLSSTSLRSRLSKEWSYSDWHPRDQFFPLARFFFDSLQKQADILTSLCQQCVSMKGLKGPSLCPNHCSQTMGFHHSPRR